MALFEYTQWNGEDAFGPDAAQALFDKLADYVMEWGEHILRHLEEIDPDEMEVLKQLVKEGYLERDEKGQFRVSPKGIRRIEYRALTELFQAEKKGGIGRHETPHKGAGQVRHEDSKPYEFGDPIAHLNLHETLKNSMLRQRGETPLRIEEDDLVVYESEHHTNCATVVLLDMSGSMARYGKFLRAKKAVLALQALVRGRFAEDTLKVVGFYTYASPLTEKELIHAAPKPVTIFDNRVFLRIALDDMPKGLPEHFTNIQAGLKYARRLLGRIPAANKQIICITDGEPTAHLEGNNLILMYPPSERTARATLQEVRACARAGITISTLALIEDYFYLGLQNFVDQMARCSRGVAVYCDAGELGGYVVDSFVHGRRARRTLRS